MSWLKLDYHPSKQGLGHDVRRRFGVGLDWIMAVGAKGS